MADERPNHPRSPQKSGIRFGDVRKVGFRGPGLGRGSDEPGLRSFLRFELSAAVSQLLPHSCLERPQKVQLDRKHYSHTLIADECLKFIRANKDKPFFCYVPFTIPHAAMQAPEDRVAPWRKKFPEFEEVTGRYGGSVIKNPVAAFAAMMTLMDEDVERILDLLEELPIEDDTLVIFTSDNGPHKEGGHKPDFFDSNGPLKGYKRDLYEGGIRVATTAWWPGKIKPGSSSAHVAAGWDLLPTLCELAGMDKPKGIDGVSFAPTLLGQPKKQEKRNISIGSFTSGEQAGRPDGQVEGHPPERPQEQGCPDRVVRLVQGHRRGKESRRQASRLGQEDGTSDGRFPYRQPELPLSSGE